MIPARASLWPSPRRRSASAANRACGDWRARRRERWASWRERASKPARARARSAALARVEALARRGEDRLARRQGAGERPQFGAPAFGEAQRRAGDPAAEIGEARQQLVAHRRRQLGGGGRRRRAQIGGVVDQRPIGLVADGGNERDVALRRGPHHDLLVEAPQVFERSAAARDDEHVGSRDRAAGRQRVEAADRLRDLSRRCFPLHPHRPHQHVDGKAIGEAMQDVADHRPGRRGDDADDARHDREAVACARRRTAPLRPA